MRSGSEPVVENLEGWGKSRDVGDRERRGEEKEGLEERKVAFAICIAEQRQSLDGWC